MKVGILISLGVWTVIVAAYLALTGCAEWQAVKSSVATHGAMAADEALITARWASCDAATVGAVRRRYSNDPEGLAAWQAYCTTRQVSAVAPK